MNMIREEPIGETELLYWMGGIEPQIRDGGEVTLTSAAENIKDRLGDWGKDEDGEETTDITISPKKINEIITNAQKTINPDVFEITADAFGQDKGRVRGGAGMTGARGRLEALGEHDGSGSNSNASEQRQDKRQRTNSDPKKGSLKMPRLDVDISKLYNGVEDTISNIDVLDAFEQFKDQNVPREDNTEESIFSRWFKFIDNQFNN